MKKYFAGLDIGSAYTKAILLDEHKNILLTSVCKTKSDMLYAADYVLSDVLTKAGIGRESVYITATGYGKQLLKNANLQENDILCVVSAAHYINKEIRTIIEVGGQDSKAIRIDEKGRVLDFVMNDKCSAGTGQFLEVIAATLGIGLEELPALSMQATKEKRLTSTCTVFAQTEIVSLLAMGERKEDIAKSVHKAISSRIHELALEIEIEDIICLAGGIALNKAIVCELGQIIGRELFVHDYSQFFAAYGAALKSIDTVKENS